MKSTQKLVGSMVLACMLNTHVFGMLALTIAKKGKELEKEAISKLVKINSEEFNTFQSESSKSSIDFPTNSQKTPLKTIKFNLEPKKQLNPELKKLLFQNIKRENSENTDSKYYKLNKSALNAIFGLGLAGGTSYILYKNIPEVHAMESYADLKFVPTAAVGAKILLNAIQVSGPALPVFATVGSMVLGVAVTGAVIYEGVRYIKEKRKNKAQVSQENEAPSDGWDRSQGPYEYWLEIQRCEQLVNKGEMTKIVNPLTGQVQYQSKIAEYSSPQQSQSQSIPDTKPIPQSNEQSINSGVKAEDQIETLGSTAVVSQENSAPIAPSETGSPGSTQENSKELVKSTSSSNTESLQDGVGEKIVNGLVAAGTESAKFVGNVVAKRLQDELGGALEVPVNNVLIKPIKGKLKDWTPTTIQDLFEDRETSFRYGPSYFQHKEQELRYLEIETREYEEQYNHAYKKASFLYYVDYPNWGKAAQLEYKIRLNKRKIAEHKQDLNVNGRYWDEINKTSRVDTETGAKEFKRANPHVEIDYATSIAEIGGKFFQVDVDSITADFKLTPLTNKDAFERKLKKYVHPDLNLPYFVEIIKGYPNSYSEPSTFINMLTSNIVGKIRHGEFVSAFASQINYGAFIEKLKAHNIDPTNVVFDEEAFALVSMKQMESCLLGFNKLNEVDCLELKNKDSILDEVKKQTEEYKKRALEHYQNNNNKNNNDNEDDEKAYKHFLKRFGTVPAAKKALEMYKKEKQSLKRSGVNLSQKSTSSTHQPHGKYVPAQYHHQNSKGIKSSGPKNGQAALDNSIPMTISSTSNARIGVSEGEIVVLNQTQKGGVSCSC